jgi:hypothetical protein
MNVAAINQLYPAADTLMTQLQKKVVAQVQQGTCYSEQ